MAKRCRFLGLNQYGSDRPNATLTRQHRQPAGSKICIFGGLVPPVATRQAQLPANARSWEGAQPGTIFLVRLCSAACALELRNTVDSVWPHCPRRAWSNNIVNRRFRVHSVERQPAGKFELITGNKSPTPVVCRKDAHKLRRRSGKRLYERWKP